MHGSNWSGQIYESLAYCACDDKPLFKPPSFKDKPALVINAVFTHSSVTGINALRVNAPRSQRMQNCSDLMANIGSWYRDCTKNQVVNKPNTRTSIQSQIASLCNKTSKNIYWHQKRSYFLLDFLMDGYVYAIVKVSSISNVVVQGSSPSIKTICYFVSE